MFKFKRCFRDIIRYDCKIQNAPHTQNEDLLKETLITKKHDIIILLLYMYYPYINEVYGRDTSNS